MSQLADRGVISPRSTTESREGLDRAKVHPVRHYGRWVAMAIVCVLVAMLAHSLVTDGNYQWGVVDQYFTASVVLSGLQLTIELTFISMGIGIGLGTVLAVMRMSPNPLIAGASSAYIWFFRGTPLLVQIIFWFNLAFLYPRLSLGLPFGPSFAHFNTNSLITTLTAAILALGLNEAAYMCEIVRAGILSVDEGQVDAAHALGMHRLLIMRRIILPQSMRVIIPPTGNETIGMLKTTSLVSVIALSDLLFSVEVIYGRTFQTIPLLIVASLWYLVCTTVLSTGQYYVERRFARGSARALPLTLIQRLRRNLSLFHATVPELPFDPTNRLR
jgi:polar amino acid transport system permease protein